MPFRMGELEPRLQQPDRERVGVRRLSATPPTQRPRTISFAGFSNRRSTSPLHSSQQATSASGCSRARERRRRAFACARLRPRFGTGPRRDRTSRGTRAAGRARPSETTGSSCRRHRPRRRTFWARFFVAERRVRVRCRARRLAPRAGAAAVPPDAEDDLPVLGRQTMAGRTELYANGAHGDFALSPSSARGCVRWLS